MLKCWFAGSRIAITVVSLSVCVALAQRSTADNAQMGVERIARFAPTGYQSQLTTSDNATVWLQLDLGSSKRIDKVKLFPVVGWGGEGVGFPVRFKIECSEDPHFKISTTIADRTGADVADPGDRVGLYEAREARGRYVRLTVTRLHSRQFSLSKMEVWSAGRDAAEGCMVSDSSTAHYRRLALTRSPRPSGEEVVTDHPENVIPVSLWRPVSNKIEPPRSGVTLEDGLFKRAMRDNITYLLSSFSVEEMLRPFQERAGKPVPSGLRKPVPFWDTELPGSNAGRFLMGAGNTLRWIDDSELRIRTHRIIDGIEDCKESDGYIMAYKPDTIFQSERAAYTRSWVTRGLIEAGYGVDPKAFRLLRGYYDWFDHCDYLPELLRRAGQGVQGMIGSTRNYFTPTGKPEDLQTVQRYFQENYWLNQLAARDPAAIWRYPYDHPHNYLITSLEPYLDLYRATGATRYLTAAQGGWDLFHDNWEHVGGSIAICEGDIYEPKSYYLHRHTGELCGSVFWMRYNQRFHDLYPDQTKYVDEIEKSIYNVVLANQVGSAGIRYHANLVGKKDSSTPICTNSCCEGQGTSAIGSLPEYIYSTSKDGLYIDLFAPSTIRWQQAGKPLSLHMETEFPFKPAVKLQVTVSAPVKSNFHVRVPAWSAHAMQIRVNNRVVAQAYPGHYASIDRIWRSGDTLSFTLPMAFRLTQYHGAEESYEPKYALEYGPILMALTGAVTDNGAARLAMSPDEVLRRLIPDPSSALAFKFRDEPSRKYIPYWQVRDELYTCYPAIGDGKPETVGADDLALESKGAIATSDSEYTKEPGATRKAIDGIIATPEDFSNRWHSSIETEHPHWIQVKLLRPAKIGRIVLRFADPQGHPTSFQGFAWVDGRRTLLFDVKDCVEWRKVEFTLKPVITDTFLLVIRASANPSYPNAAQVSEIEIYPAKPAPKVK